MALDVDGGVSIDTPSYTVDGLYSGATQTYPGIRIEFAFGYAPLATAGGADIPDAAWTDVTQDVRVGCSIRRGRSSEFDGIGPGEASFTLVDFDRTYDPTNVLSPHYGSLLPRTPVRICADYNSISYCLFRGFVDGFPQSYDPSDKVTWINVRAFDLLALMAGWSMIPLHQFVVSGWTAALLDSGNLVGGSAPVLPEERTGQRIARLLDVAGVPDIYQDIDEGSSLVARAAPASRDFWTHIQAVAATELGRLWVDPMGVVTFRDRHHLPNTPEALFSDSAGWGIAYSGLEVDPLALDQVRNEIVRQVAGVDVFYRDTVSITNYGLISDSRTDLLHASTQDAAASCQYLVGRYATPVPRIRSMVVKPGRYPTYLFPGVLDWDLGTCLVVSRTPQHVGADITQTVRIEQIEHRFDGRDWTVIYGLSQPDVTEYWRPDDATFGQLDADHLVAY